MMTSQKQILQNGADGSTCSPQDFHASPSAWPDIERERTMTATSGRRLSELYTKSDPLGSLERTLLESSRWFSPARRLKWEAKPLFSERVTLREYRSDRSSSSKPSAATLSVKDIPSGRLLFRLVPSEHPTDGTGFGLLQEELLPTPTARDNKNGSKPEDNRTKRKLQQGWTLELNDMAAKGLLPTPNAAEGEKYTTKYNPNSHMGKSLTAMAMNDMLPTPTTSCHNAGTTANRKDGKSRESELNHLIARQVGQTSQLNPLFVCDMMGFPITWLDI